VNKENNAKTMVTDHIAFYRFFDIDHTVGNYQIEFICDYIAAYDVMIIKE